MMAAFAKAHEGMRDEHANLHGHHAALSELHEKAGSPEIARLHHGMAGHHLKLAEHHADMADALATAPTEPTKATPAKPAAHAKGGDSLAKGAANQLLGKGHIDSKTHARIHREASKRRPFGSIGGGAGHYEGDVDTANSGGTNSAP